MKKILSLVAIAAIGLGTVCAQEEAHPNSLKIQDESVKEIAMQANAQAYKKPTREDHRKKDGTPDRRFRENKRK